jgi:hypothetical protein
MSESKKVLNYTLADGLLITSAKVRKNAPLAICYITDFTTNGRIVLDLEGKRVISSPVDIGDEDLGKLIAAIVE